MKRIGILSLLLLLGACNSDKKEVPAKQAEKKEVPVAPLVKKEAPIKVLPKEEFPEFVEDEMNEPIAKTEEKAKKPVVEASKDIASGVLGDFLKNVNIIEKVGPGNPIAIIQGLAEKEAKKSFVLKKDNLKTFLAECATNTHCLITTGDHTIMKITDLKDCKQSGAWQACMPKGKGFIKKGDLIPQEDYLNNVIGIPDAQKRMAWVF